MKNVFLIPCLILVFNLSSCKKDTAKEPEMEPELPVSPTTFPNYSNLRVGNYWIYQRFEIDGSGNETPLALIDSCFIEKDTIINGNKYYKYVSPNFGMGASPYTIAANVSEFYRDSLSYLITNYGRVEFSSADFTTIFQSSYMVNPPSDTICRLEHKMADQNSNVTTPLGTFLTSNYKGTYYMYPSFTIPGQAVRTRSTKYSEGVGKVTQEWYFFVGLSTKWERRLIRYHLN